MCRRNESAVTVKWRWSPRRSHAASRITRTNTSCLRLGGRERGEVVLAGEERRARLRGASRSTGRGHQSERLASSADRADRLRTTYRYERASAPRSARGSPRGASSAASTHDVGRQRRVERLGGPVGGRAPADARRSRPGPSRARPCRCGRRRRGPPSRRRRSRRAPRGGRPRPSAGPAAAPSRGSRCRRTRSSASASSRPAFSQAAQARLRRDDVEREAVDRGDRRRVAPGSIGSAARALQISPSTRTCPGARRTGRAGSSATPVPADERLARRPPRARAAGGAATTRRTRPSRARSKIAAATTTTTFHGEGRNSSARTSAMSVSMAPVCLPRRERPTRNDERAPAGALSSVASSAAGSGGGGRIVVDELEQHHRRGVALARPELDDPRVAAVAAPRSAGRR